MLCQKIWENCPKKCAKLYGGSDEPAHLVNVDGGASPAQVPELGDHGTGLRSSALVCPLSTGQSTHCCTDFQHFY